MVQVKVLASFSLWLAGLPDARVKAVIAARIRRLSLGLPGDVSPVGEGVSELRIHLGAGWRVYFVQHGVELIVLLGRGRQENPGRRHPQGKSIGKDVEVRSSP